MQITNLENLDEPLIPPGYQIRTFQKGDEEAWLRIIKSSFGENFPANLNEILKDIVSSPEFDPESLFFIVHNNKLVGTVCAWHKSFEGHTVGYIHMLGVVPQHQGKKLGRLLTIYALKFLKRKGFQEVILDTDDFRIPAIKTYLNLGFKPVYLEPNHKQRWDAIFKEINKRIIRERTVPTIEENLRR